MARRRWRRSALAGLVVALSGSGRVAPVAAAGGRAILESSLAPGSGSGSSPLQSVLAAPLGAPLSGPSAAVAPAVLDAALSQATAATAVTGIGPAKVSPQPSLQVSAAAPAALSSAAATPAAATPLTAPIQQSFLQRRGASGPSAATTSIVNGKVLSALTQNSPTVGLPSGNLPQPAGARLSASQIAAAQQQNAETDARIKAEKSGKELISTDGMEVRGANVPSDAEITYADGTPVVPNQRYVVRNNGTAKHTLAEVNAGAPSYTTPDGLTFRPQVTQEGAGSVPTSSGFAQGAAPSTQGGQGGQSVTATQSAAATTTTSTRLSGKELANQPPGAPSGNRPLDAATTITGAQPYDLDFVNGEVLSFLTGVRVSTPVFGSGFNLCVDRYFGTFPKVGIVIPNAAAWLLPEFQVLADTLVSTIQFPTVLPKGATITPTGDGFLIWLPTFQPSQLPNFGFRYGIQIGQAFGLDFGYGNVRSTCGVGFALV